MGRRRKTGRPGGEEIRGSKHSLVILGVFPVAEVRTGGQKRYIELTRQLAEKGHRVYQLCRPSMADELPGTGIGVIPDKLKGFLVPRWWRYRFWVRRRLRRIAAAIERDPDVVLTFGETNFFAARAAARYFDAPLVFALRNNFVDEVRTLGLLRRRLPVPRGVERWLQIRWYLRLEGAVCRGADRIVFQSEHDRDTVTARHPEALGRSLVIPNSFRVSWLAPEYAEANRSHRLKRGLYIGHLNHRKGVEYLFAALARLGGRLPFDVVGFGGLEEWCRTFVEANGLSASVVFHGRIDRPVEFLASTDLLVVPSLFDSFPNTVLEALYVGTPVIGSDAPGIKTMLEKPALLFARRDAAALAVRLEQLLDDPGEYRDVRDACAERRQEFDFDWAARWVELFRGLPGGTSRAAGS
jgi:glycosyltransferase involved in cell wall biosynthesis